MANYCPNCGAAVSSGDSFCASCGASLNGAAASSGASSGSSSGKTAAAAAGGALGTLVAVTLLGGVTRNLYYYGGRYFLDPYCRRPYMYPGRIVGGPRMIGPRGGFGGPHGGGFGGPHGGGPGGGHGGPGGGGGRR